MCKIFSILLYFEKNTDQDHLMVTMHSLKTQESRPRLFNTLTPNHMWLFQFKLIKTNKN